MSKPIKKDLLTYNSIISLSLVAECKDKKKLIYIMRSETLDQSIILKQTHPLADFCLVKESLFIIRPKALTEIPSLINDSTQAQNQSDLTVPLEYNQEFIFQHMVSKKYLSKTQINGSDYYILKLTEQKHEAIPFSFKRIVDTKSNNNSIQMKQIVYLCPFIKEKGVSYYINRSHTVSKRNQNFSEVRIEKEFKNKFMIIDQNSFAPEDNYLHSCDLVNIVFQTKDDYNPLSMMLGVKCKKEEMSDKIETSNVKQEAKENIENLDDQKGNVFIDMELDMKKEYGSKTIKDFNYSNELNEHTNHFSFWILEEEKFCHPSKIQKTPLAAECYVRIKNPILNMYLKIQKAGKGYEFALVDEKDLIVNSIFFSNFQIFHYSINQGHKNLTDNGKYVIKGIFKEFDSEDQKNLLNINSIYSYFEPIVIKKGSCEPVPGEKGEEFVFEIKKVNIFKGNEAIYLKGISEQLYFLVKLFSKKTGKQREVIDLISNIISFLTSYLMNLDYSFKDINYDSNYPIRERQNLLYENKILDIINQIICYFLHEQNNKEVSKDNVDSSAPLSLQFLLKQILSFLKFLSQSNDNIKKELYWNMRKILELGEALFKKNTTILLEFIFFILKDSRELQEMVLGSNTNLRNCLLKDQYFVFKNISNFDQIKDSSNFLDLGLIYSYMERSPYYLYYYNKILPFDKEDKGASGNVGNNSISDNSSQFQLNNNANVNIIPIANANPNDNSCSSADDEEINPKANINPNPSHNPGHIKNQSINDNIAKLKEKKEETFNNYLSLFNDSLQIVKCSKVRNEEERKNIMDFITFFERFNFKRCVRIKDICFANLKEKLNLNNKDDNNKANDKILENKIFFFLNDELIAQNKAKEAERNALAKLWPIILIETVNEYIDKPPIKRKDSDPNNLNNNNNNALSVNSITIKQEDSDEEIEDESLQELNAANKREKDEKDKEEKQIFLKHLYILYSVYLFCITQSFNTIYALIKSYKNVLINYSQGDLFDNIKNTLTSLKDKLLNHIYFEDSKDREMLNKIKSNTLLYQYNFPIDLITNDDTSLIIFLFKFAKTYTKIMFLIDKIRFTKSNNKSEYKKNIEDNQNNILSLYQEVNEKKKTLLVDGKFKIESIMSYVIQHTITLLTAYLGKFDYEEYTKKIIRIEPDEELFLSHIKTSDIEIKALRKLLSDKLVTQESEKMLKILSIKERNELIRNMNESLNKITNEFKLSSTKSSSHLMDGIINMGLGFGLNTSGGFNNSTGLIPNMSSTQLNNAFSKKQGIPKEKEYFRRIDFPKTFHNLLHVINSFANGDPKNSQILQLTYCKEILDIFDCMNKNYKRYNKVINENYTLYMEFIMKSLQGVNRFYDCYRDDYDEKTYLLTLEIIYKSARSFLDVIENCKANFSDFKNLLTEIFEIFKQIYRKLPKVELKIDYHLFYTHLVTRVLLFLNKNKAYDFYHYEMVFRKIYPFDQMRLLLASIIAQIDKKSNENSDNELVLTKLSYQLIYIYILTIYTIYLNELNSIRKTASVDANNIISMKFKQIYRKIKYLLDKNDTGTDDVFTTLPQSTSNNNNININLNNNLINNNNNNLNVNNNNMQIISPAGGGGGYITPDSDTYSFLNFEFESALLQAIINYKFEKKVLEIHIKDEQDSNTVKRKHKDNKNWDKDKDEDDSIQTFNQYRFYYYDVEFIDIIILEKLIRDIKIKDYIKDIFHVKDFKSSAKDTDMFFRAPLDILLQYKIEFNTIMSQATQEQIYYKILHDQYIKKDLTDYLDDLIHQFNHRDEKKITAMKYFNYIKMNEMYTQRRSTAIEHVKSKGNSNNKGNSYPSFNGIDSLFLSIKYLYPHKTNSLAIIYKCAFNLLKLQLESNAVNLNRELLLKKDSEIDFELLIQSLTELFRRESNHKLILDNSLLFIVLEAISQIFTTLSRKEKMAIILKNQAKIKQFLASFDFLFIHLADKLEKIVKFMKNPESRKIVELYDKKDAILKKIIHFITNVIKFDNINSVNILSENIQTFNSKIIEQIIKLIFILLEFNNQSSNTTVISLMDFITNFINGPNIENLKLLFNQGYFDLMKYVINKIDYYQIFLKNVNKKELYTTVNTMIQIEYKIMKIFFIYFNIVNNDRKDLTHYKKVRKFYDEQYENIQNKLKRIFYISQKEFPNENYDIDKMLLFYNSLNFYSDKDYAVIAGLPEDEGNDNDKAKMSININPHGKKRQYCIIKFEIILTYYTLFIQYREELMYSNFFDAISTDETIFHTIYFFFYKLIAFIINILISPYHFFKIVSDCVKNRERDVIDLFAVLYDIDEKYMKVNEKEMMDYMQKNITSVEVSIKDVVYKIQFPLLTKCKKLKRNFENYLSDDTEQLENYIIHIMNNYDDINIQATQNHRIDRVFEVPLVRVIFLNVELFKTLSYITAIVTNILILCSYSDKFNNTQCKFSPDPNKPDPRLDCPYLFYKGNPNNLNTTNKVFNSVGWIQVIITIVLFFNYYIRKFATQLKEAELAYNMESFKNKKKSNCCDKVNHIFFPTLFHSFINFESLYYILALAFSILGITIHNFFYGFMLVELIVRIKVMKNVLLAIYVPKKQIIITLILFLILLYFFTLFGLVYFNSHFPNANDTTNVFAAFLRMFDQTFKQDGGVGMYLQQNLDPIYEPYIPRAFVGLRFWYDNLFFYLILILIFQMFLSIIKDYFSNQRGMQETFDETLKKECLVCGIQRELIEKIYSNEKNAFDIHVKNDHNVTNYICYLAYLQSLAEKEQIVEEKVWKYHLRKNYLFLPKNTCFKLREKKSIENVEEEKVKKE